MMNINVHEIVHKVKKLKTEQNKMIKSISEKKVYKHLKFYYDLIQLFY